MQHGAPEGSSLFRAANGRDPVEADSEPKHVQHAPQYHMATGKRKRRTLKPLPAEIGRRAQVRRQPQRRNPRKDRRFKCALQTSVSY